MRVKNIEGFTPQDLKEEADKGARFIYFRYTISVLLYTFQKNSGVYMVWPNEKPVRKAIPYIIVSSLLGWWGFPSGPSQTVAGIRTNLRGGVDVTEEYMATVHGHLLFEESERQKKAS